MVDEPLFIGASRAAPPEGGVVRFLAPAQEVSSSELAFIGGPKVILGGSPCDHWAKVVRERTDTLYVIVGDGAVPEGASAGAIRLPAASVAQLRCYFSHLLQLRQRYPAGLPQIDGATFRWKGREASLTETEAALVAKLFDMEGSVVGREELSRISAVRNEGSRALEAHIHRLRRKLAIPGVELLTERQRGFRLVLS